MKTLENYQGEEEVETVAVPVKDDENAQLFLENRFINIPEIGLKFTTGEYTLFNKEDNSWEPDFSLTVLYDSSESDLKNYVFWEQDPPEIAIWNYLRASDRLKFKNLDEILKLPVEIQC